jgi:iron complex outermembrane receptor protein
VEKAENKTLDNKIPVEVAEKMFKAFLEYDLPFIQGLSVNGGFNYNGKSYGNANNTDKIPSYLTYDLGAGYATEIQGLPVKFSVSVHNVGDKHYWQSPTYLGAPRTFLFTAMIKFK